MSPRLRDESSLSAISHCLTQEPSLPFPVPAKRPEAATITGISTISIVAGDAEVVLAPLDATEVAGPLRGSAAVVRFS